MLKLLERFLIYLGKFVADSKTGSPSVKRFGLALAITILCSIIFAIGIVICFVTLHSSPQYTVEMVRILAGTLEILAGLVLTAVTTGYLVDKAKMRDKEDVDKTTTNTTTEDN